VATVAERHLSTNWRRAGKLILPDPNRSRDLIRQTLCQSAILGELAE
jgi:hypothetical protein